MKKTAYRIFVLMVFAFCLDMPLHAKEGTDSQWKVSVSPFAWLVGIDGTVKFKGRSADVNMSMGDILDNMDVAGELHVEAFNGTYGLFVEPNYLKMSEDVTATLPISGAEVKSKYTATTLFIEFGGFSRLVDIKNEAGGHNTIDLIGGLRYWDMENEVKLSVPVAGVDREAKTDTTFLDPFVGFRLKAYMAGRVPYSLRADIGGLNIGSSSTFTYNLQALVGFDVTQSITVFGGYRILSVDYGDSEDGFEIMQHGPALGANITF